MRRIGVISDTHGLLRPQALAALRGCDPIIHAGDVGSPDILDALRRIAPVFAVRGNVDKGDWAGKLPLTELVQIDGFSLYVLHILDELNLDPPTAGFHAVIYGHSHQPKIETRNDAIYFNPGSAGPRRFNLPVTLGQITIAEDGLRAEIVALEE